MCLTEGGEGLAGSVSLLFQSIPLGIIYWISDHLQPDVTTVLISIQLYGPVPGRMGTEASKCYMHIHMSHT